MTNRSKTKQELLAQIEALRAQLGEAQETLDAIRSGAVDALVVSGPDGDNVFTLSGADRPYRVLIEAMSEGALTLSPDGVILYSNTRFADLVGSPLEQVIGSPLFQYVSPEDRARAVTLIARCCVASERDKFNLMCADGRRVPAQLSAQAVDLGNGQAICLVVTDLTKVVAVEEQLRRAHDELEQRVEERTAELRHANELRLRFLAMVSHELRTPLTSIKGFATTLLANDITWDTDSQHDFIQTIDVEADKLTEMIDQILDLSRIEAGTLRINPAPADLGAIVSGILPDLYTLAGNHELQVNIPAGLPRMHVDRDRVAQVIMNLIENAGKYSPQHTMIEIRAQHQPVENKIQVTIADQGPGIPASEVPGIFEAFRRGEGAHRIKGAGLGLAICKGLVEAHGGRISILDHEGPGAVISFTLPVVAGSK